MNLKEFKCSKDDSLERIQCKLYGLSGTDKQFSDECGTVSPASGNLFKIIMNDGSEYLFETAEKSDFKRLENMLACYSFNLAYVSKKDKEHDFFFLTVFFFYSSGIEEKLNIVLSGYVKKQLRNISKNRSFEDLFLLPYMNGHCYAYSFINQKGTDQERGLAIYGKDYVLNAIKKIEDNVEYLFADSIFPIKEPVPMMIHIGDLSFKDEKQFISERIREKLKKISGFLTLWEEYSKLEGDFLLEKARKIGQIKINWTSYNQDKDGCVVYFEKTLTTEQREYLSKGDFLYFCDELPIYITDKAMTWEDYKGTDEYKNKKEKTDIEKIKIKEISENNITLDEAPKSRKRFIVYDIQGDSTQIRRRERARKMIEEAITPLPALGLVIEGKTSGIGSNKINREIEPITPFVKEKIFKREPRQAQRDAIEIALNTPDIAIIQGPPGTGKTTVITAIVERLNELFDKRKNNAGQILVTSFQHDAVINVTERMKINSLPTLKFGSRKDDEDNPEENRAFLEWCSNYAEKLKIKNPILKNTDKQEQLDEEFNRYLISPSREKAIDFLVFVKKLNSCWELKKNIDDLLSQLCENNDANFQNEHSVQIIEKIRRLRTSKAAFLDDGPYNAYELLCDLENKLLQFLPKDKVEQKDYIIALRKAADALPEEADEVLFQELSETKNKLLMKFLNKPSYNTAFFSDNILEIYRKAKKSLQPVLTEKDNILCTLLKSVEDSSSEIADTIRKYNIVFAATAQQSEGNRIKLAKQIDPRRHPVYDTVIIDEAARVNPGDLMIPMSQAKRRIIFVGDHRQLPHVYDEEIFEAMKDNGSNIGKDTIKKSMFQYLKEKTEELTRQDGKKRSITLDAQFRMHPDLGKFISDNFYRPYGEGFLSPLGAENFAQNISKKPYQWVNIPSSKGKEEKVGTSRRRKCEAEYIVNTIQTYLDGKGENLSYGIITFYKAQADVIKKMLQKKGLNDKVRVGSVDAFQGMEFDVIFLSVVRSSSKTPKGEDIKKANEIMQEKKDSNKISERENFLEETGMRYYGFLTKENRLCVALSRQKKLLIVVGDSYIFSSSAYNDLASVCVPALHKFYLLCKEGGQVING